MKSIAATAMPFLVAFLVFSCSGGQGTGNIKIKKGPMPEGARWTGTYYTNWGTMELTQSGTSIVGTFGDRNGVIEGTASGNLLTFHWSEDAKSSLTSTKKKVEGSGVMMFYVVETGEGKIDEHKIEGSWGYGSETSGAGKWSGYKSSKDVKDEQRLHLIGGGGTSKSTSNIAGDVDSDYVPPPQTQDKKKVDDFDDIPPPQPE